MRVSVIDSTPHISSPQGLPPRAPVRAKPLAGPRVDARVQSARSGLKASPRSGTPVARHPHVAGLKKAAERGVSRAQPRSGALPARRFSPIENKAAQVGAKKTNSASYAAFTPPHIERVNLPSHSDLKQIFSTFSAENPSPGTRKNMRAQSVLTPQMAKIVRDGIDHYGASAGLAIQWLRQVRQHPNWTAKNRLHTLLQKNNMAQAIRYQCAYVGHPVDLVDAERALHMAKLDVNKKMVLEYTEADADYDEEYGFEPNAARHREKARAFFDSVPNNIKRNQSALYHFDYVQRQGPLVSSVSHTIAFHVGAQGEIKFFDAKRGEYQVSRADFGKYMTQYMADNYTHLRTHEAIAILV
ncbi:MAG: hypothetical protein IT497_05760 [Ottowia sp.]|nr:hypothetical protein [Ottowia sp.]